MRYDPKSTTWWRRQHCRVKGHHHTRDRRYCYWEVQKRPEAIYSNTTNHVMYWRVQDRITGRKVSCLNLKQVRVWIAAARAFERTYLEKAYDKCRRIR